MTDDTTGAAGSGRAGLRAVLAGIMITVAGWACVGVLTLALLFAHDHRSLPAQLAWDLTAGLAPTLTALGGFVLLRGRSLLNRLMVSAAVASLVAAACGVLLIVSVAGW